MFSRIKDEINQIKARRWDPANPITKQYYKAPGEHIGFHYAIVVDNKDPQAQGRVKVHLTYMGDNFVTDWVPVLRPFAGKETGSWFLPEVDERVLCAFINDKPDRPVVMGTLYTSKIKPPVKNYGDSNLKVFKTKGGTELIMDDTDGKERLTLCTKDGKMRLSMDGEDGIYLVNEEGDIEITCEKFIVKSEEAAAMAFTKDLKITSESGDIQIQTKKQMTFKAQSEAELKGSKIKLKGDTGVTAGGKQMAAKDDYAVGIDFHQIEVPTPGGLSPVPMVPHPYLGKLSDKLSDDVTVNDREAAVKGSKSKYDTPGHIPMPPGVKFSSNPSNEGEVSSGTAPTVKVNGKEAAVIGSMVKTCNDPSDQETCSIVAIGMSVALPIVLPGTDPDQYEKDGGTIFNMREAGASAAAAGAMAALAQSGQTQEKFDSSKPRSITSVKWSAAKAKLGESVSLSANLSNQYNNATVYFRIYTSNSDPEKDRPMKVISGTNKNGKADASWKYKLKSSDEPLTKPPEFFFTAKSFCCDKVKSGNIKWSDKAEVKILTPQGKAPKEAAFILTGADGKEQEFTPGDDGLITCDDMVPGQYTLTSKEKGEGEAVYSGKAKKDASGNYIINSTVIELMTWSFHLDTGKSYTIIIKPHGMNFSS